VRDSCGRLPAGFAEAFHLCQQFRFDPFARGEQAGYRRVHAGAPAPDTDARPEARDALNSYGLGIFKTEISQRIAYVEAIVSGVSVLKYSPNSVAAREIRDLCDEIL